MAVNPDISEAHLLRGWYDDGGASTSFTAHSSAGAGSGASINRNEMRTISEVKDAQLGMNEEKPDYFSTRATIMHIKPDNISYPACQTEGCSKKVIESHDGWKCEKCDRSYPKPQYRSALSQPDLRNCSD